MIIIELYQNSIISSYPNSPDAFYKCGAKTIIITHFIFFEKNPHRSFDFVHLYLLTTMGFSPSPPLRKRQIITFTLTWVVYAASYLLRKPLGVVSILFLHRYIDRNSYILLLLRHDSCENVGYPIWVPNWANYLGTQLPSENKILKFFQVCLFALRKFHFVFPSLSIRWARCQDCLLAVRISQTGCLDESDY